MNKVIQAPINSTWTIEEYNFGRVSRMTDWFADSGALSFKAMGLNLYGGFSLTQGAIGVFKLNDADAAKAVKEIQDVIHDYSNRTGEVIFKGKVGESDSITVTYGDLLSVLTNLFVGKDNQVRSIEYGVTYGFRRTFATLLAIAIQRKLKMPETKSIPAVVTSSDINERRMLCLAENGGKTGIKKIELKNLMPTVYHLCTSGKKATYLYKEAKLPSYGAAQRMELLVKLNKKYPDLKIVDRITSGEFQILGTKPLVDLYKGDINSGTVEAALLGLSTDKEGKATPSKRGMSGPTCVQIAETTPSDFISHLLLAVNDNKGEFFAALTKHAAEIDAVWFKIKDEVLTDANAATTAVRASIDEKKADMQQKAKDAVKS